MPTRESFTMGLVPVGHVVFPGIVSSVLVRARGHRGAVKRAANEDHSMVFSLERPDHEPSTVAATGRILDLTEENDGLILRVAGIQRVHLISYFHEGTALKGKFRYASDDEENIPPLLIEEAWALASELWAMVQEPGARSDLPSAPPLLSYWVAAHVPLNAATRQELLEIPTSRGRLAKEISLMRTLLDGLRTQHSS